MPITFTTNTYTYIHVHDFLREIVIANRIQLGGSDKKFNYCFSVRKYGKNKAFLFSRMHTNESEGIVAVILYSREREEEKNKEKVE